MLYYKKCKQKGAFFVEAALIVPFAIFLLFNLYFLGLTIFDKHTIDDIAREGCRYAIIKYADDPTDASQQYVKNLVVKRCGERLNFYTCAENGVVIEYGQAKEENTGRPIKLTITATNSGGLGYLYDTIVPTTITGTAVMRVEEHSGN